MRNAALGGKVVREQLPGAAEAEGWAGWGGAPRTTKNAGLKRCGYFSPSRRAQLLPGRGESAGPSRREPGGPALEPTCGEPSPLLEERR